MDYIRKVLQKGDPSMENLLNCLETVKNNGDIVLVKFDGERSKNHYTVLITFPNGKGNDMIRADEDNLKTALVKVLNKYIQKDN